MTKHPVHFVTKEGKLSPSAFIPFCEFGGNMSAIGTTIDNFNVPVCNSFQSRIKNNQLCYQVDLNKMSNKIQDDMKKKMDLGFAFIMDYNEDRQVSSNRTAVTKNRSSNLVSERGLVSRKHVDSTYNAYIYLDTMGNEFL